MPFKERARAWAAGDCDESTAAQVHQLIADGNEAALRELFDGRVEFGTAGLRAKVGPGPLRLNLAVIRRTTRSVGEHLITNDPNAHERPVVVGFDGRLTSRQFAEETCGVLAAMGIPVRYFTEPMPTPIVAYAILHYKACAGVVITASHNTKEYNGYKLYAENGAQIISPADAKIAELIANSPPANAIDVARDLFSTPHSLAEPVSSSVVTAYFEAIGKLRPAGNAARDLPIIYTPLHGVGYAPVKRALSEAGFTRVIPVAEQAEPDGNFPTVSFPNPEEKGALDLALEYAKRHDATLVLANDPDADRLSVCVKRPNNSWVQLTGNQIGLLLADYQLSRYTGTATPLVVCSIVSSPMLESIATQYGARSEKVLTGFKWVWNAALDLRAQEGLHFVFGFEEALGYCAEDIVRDKDGVSAALLFAELTAEEASHGSSILARLEKLYRHHGLWVSYQLSITKEGIDGLQALRTAVDLLAVEPPASLNGQEVTRCIDYRSGGDVRPRWLESSPMIELRVGSGNRVLVRPSGTEPKLKIYIDLRRELSAEEDVWAAEKAALAEAQALAQAVRAATRL